MNRGSCIWCLKDSSDSDVEHIFPEALGCPNHLTLPGSIVCKRCNNGLAHLDQVVVSDFDFLLLMHGINRKRGRAPAVDSRGNVHAITSTDGVGICFNLDSVDHVTPWGNRVGSYKGRSRDIKPKIEKLRGKLCSVEFEVNIGQDEKFPRGMYKIALNSIAYMLGPAVARSENFDWLREYVNKGGKRRRILLTSVPNQSFTVTAFPPMMNAHGEYALEVRIALANFLLDLSEEESLIPMFEQEALSLYGESGYSVFPMGSSQETHSK